MILADTMTPPGPRPPRLLQLADGAVIWAGRKAEELRMLLRRAPPLSLRPSTNRRLLYVAMTRAADRLIVGGADGVNRRPAGCWYNLVRDALDPLLVAEGENDEKVFRFRKPEAEEPAPPAALPEVTTADDRREAPSWLRHPAPPKHRARRGFRRLQRLTKKSPAPRRRAPPRIGKELSHEAASCIG